MCCALQTRAGKRLAATSCHWRAIDLKGSGSNVQSDFVVSRAAPVIAEHRERVERVKAV